VVMESQLIFGDDEMASVYGDGLGLSSADSLSQEGGLGAMSRTDFSDGSERSEASIHGYASDCSLV